MAYFAGALSNWRETYTQASFNDALQVAAAFYNLSSRFLRTTKSTAPKGYYTITCSPPTCEEASHTKNLESAATPAPAEVNTPAFRTPVITPVTTPAHRFTKACTTQAPVTRRVVPTKGSAIVLYNASPVLGLASCEIATKINSAAIMADHKPKPDGSVAPVYVSSQRDFDEMIRSMAPCFEDRESEANWIQRDRNVTKLRGLTFGNAPHDYHTAYAASIKGLCDGILKTANSLRTTLSTNGCQLIQDIAVTDGSVLDPVLEVLLQNLIKLSGGTKKISQQNGNKTVDTVIGKITYNKRVLEHLWGACQDKNVQPRIFAAGWIKTLINCHGHNKSQIEHSGGLEILEKCLAKGLEDANPTVRTSMRSSYFEFEGMWPSRASR